MRIELHEKEVKAGLPNVQLRVHKSEMVGRDMCRCQD